MPPGAPLLALPIAAPPSRPAAGRAAPHHAARPHRPARSVRPPAPLAAGALGLVAIVALVLTGHQLVSSSAAAYDRTSAAATPSRPPGGTPAGAVGAADGDIARLVTTVRVPAVSPAAADGNGRRVRPAGELLDGDARTAWRIPGDATGRTITLTFARPVTLTRVGLVDASPVAAHHPQDRRVSRVAWSTGAGRPVVVQHLPNGAREATLVALQAPPTRTLRLTIEATSPTGEPAAGTAIGDIVLEGH